MPDTKPQKAARPAFGKDFGLGWVGFVHSGSRLSGAIAYLTRRDKQTGRPTITHAFVVPGPDECVEATLPAGVVVTRLSVDYLDRDDRLVIFRKPVGLTQEAGARIAALAKAQVGAKFDFGAFAAEGLASTF